MRAWPCVGYLMIASEKLKSKCFYSYFERVKTKMREGKQLSPGHILVAKHEFTLISAPLQAVTQVLAPGEVHRGRGLNNI